VRHDDELIETSAESDEAERERFRAYQANPTREARNELVDAYGSLAHALARRFARRGEDTNDLVQVAFYALIRAVERFDPDRGTAFVSFAVPTILGEIKRHFRDRTWGAHVARSAKDLIPTVNQASDDLYRELQRPPTPTEVANRIGRSVDQVLEAIDARRAYRPASLNAPATGSNAAPQDVAVVEKGISDTLNTVTVRKLLSTLPERERHIVELRFYDDLSQSEIAARMGISQMHVSRLLRKALALLAAQLESSDGAP
jgi:RNA polymerase sigma-B factor